MAPWRFLHLDHWGKGQICTISYWVTIIRTGRERRKNSKLQDLQRVVQNAFRVLMSRFRVLLGTMVQMSKFVRDIVFTCMVLHTC